ncbi:MAG: DUF2339 domain-containing protein [Candidatus Acidiferrales bacterium]
MPLVILIAIFVLVIVPILAIVAFVRVRHLEETAGQSPQLTARIYTLEQRLAQIEKNLATILAASAAPKVATSADVAPSAPVPEQARPAPVAPVPSPAFPATPPATPIKPTHPPLQPANLAPPALSSEVWKQTATPAESANFETLVAGRWMNYIGILAILFAVAFFLKYAFENNWIGPRGRVGIGLLMGAALFPWSHRLLDRGYKYFSEGIAGLGAAVLYLSLWAGWHYYLVFSQTAAFAMMIVVTALTTIVAVGRNSERIAVLALVGGIVTPELVSTGENHEITLFTYMAVLGVGVLALARARDWKSLPPIQFVATLVYFWGWYSDFYADDALATTVFFATLFFVLFAVLPVVRSRREGELSLLENGIVFVNSIAYLIALRTMFWPEHRWALTIAVLVLATIHLAIERALPQKKTSGPPLTRIIFAGLALTFVTLAIPIRLDGRWITIAWAVEGAVLIWSGLRTQIRVLRAAGFLLFAVAACRLAFIPLPASQFLLNARFATFAITVACFLLACYFARAEDAHLAEQEQMIFLATAIAANIYALAALSLEIWDYFQRMPSLGIDRGLAQQLSLSSLWLVYALGLLAAGIWKKSAVLRWQALALLGVVIGKVFLFDLSFLERFYRIISFLLLGLALMLISFFYQRRMAGREGGTKA